MPYPSWLRIRGFWVTSGVVAAVAAACNSPDFDIASPTTGGIGGVSVSSGGSASTGTTTGSGGAAGADNVPEHCSNGVADGTESDTDCGGGDCKRCRRGEECAVAADCENDACTKGICQDPGCGDEVQNGDETDIDCGGEVCSACSAPRACLLDRDCQSNNCDDNRCQPSSCDDNIQNGDETDTDCGGPDCKGCEVGDSCKVRSDCEAPPNAGSESVACSDETETCELICGSTAADCNQSAHDGCEVTLATDTDHCGACDHACDLDNADQQCSGGTCHIVACAEGFQNCNNVTEDGCEVDITSDPDNCGTCNEECSSHHGSPTCEAGECGIECDEGFENCNDDLIDGCEANLARDVEHCLSCAGMCEESDEGFASFCSAEGCGETECDAGVGDCNGDGECSDDLTSVDDCGRCGHECYVPHGTPACDEGACTIGECDSGDGRVWEDCDELPANGCERDLNNDRRFCGACDNDCTAMLEAGFHVTDVGCREGGCAITSCEMGYADCDGDFDNGCEVDITTDSSACGGCSDDGGVVCDDEYKNGRGVCEDAKCKFLECEDEYGDCDEDAGAGRSGNGCESEITFNEDHCGACDRVCETGTGTSSNTCGGPNGSTCLPDCADGYDDCDGNPNDGCETNLLGSDQNCGACGNECEDINSQNQCVDGVCSPSCNANFRSCDSDPNDGCEQSIHTVAHCGGCNESCSTENGGVASCATGSCSVTCSAPYRDCSANENVARDGCETNTNTDEDHCGGCGASCGGSHVSQRRCTSGTCNPVCSTGWCVDDDPALGCTQALGTVDNCSACGDSCGGTTPFCLDDGGSHCDFLDIEVVNSVGTSAAFNSGQAALSLNHPLSGSSADYRMVVIAVSSYFGQPTSVTYAGLSLGQPVETEVVETQNWLGIYIALESQLPSGNQGAVVVQLGNGWGWGQVNVMQFNGVDQNDPIVNTASSSNALDCQGTELRDSGVTFSNVPGSFVYAAISARNVNTATLQAGTFTSRFNAATQGPGGGSEHGFMATATSGPQSNGTTASWSMQSCYNHASAAIGIHRAESL